MKLVQFQKGVDSEESTYYHKFQRRGETFVTRKLARVVAQIKVPSTEKLCLENLDAKIHWGYAKEYVAAMWLMLWQEEPDD